MIEYFNPFSTQNQKCFEEFKELSLAKKSLTIISTIAGAIFGALVFRSYDSNIAFFGRLILCPSMAGTVFRFSVKWLKSTVNSNDRAELKKDPITVLNTEVICLIFTFAKEDLPAIAGVNKSWKEIAYDEGFRKGICPTEHFLDNEVYNKLPGVSVAKEPHLPLCIYRDVGADDFLAVIHKNIMLNQKKVDLDLNLISQLAERATGFQTWNGNLREFDVRIGSENTHWVHIKKGTVGKDKKTQVESSFCDNKILNMHKLIARRNGGSISGIRDTLACLIFDRVKTNNSKFNWDPEDSINTEEVRNCRYVIYFESDGLWPHLPMRHSTISGVAVARKSVAQN